jgi:hypothetical protein
MAVNGNHATNDGRHQISTADRNHHHILNDKGVDQMTFDELLQSAKNQELDDAAESEASEVYKIENRLAQDKSMVENSLPLYLAAIEKTKRDIIEEMHNRRKILAFMKEKSDAMEQASIYSPGDIENFKNVADLHQFYDRFAGLAESAAFPHEKPSRRIDITDYFESSKKSKLLHIKNTKLIRQERADKERAEREDCFEPSEIEISPIQADYSDGLSPETNDLHISPQVDIQQDTAVQQAGKQLDFDHVDNDHILHDHSDKVSDNDDAIRIKVKDDDQSELDQPKSMQWHEKSDGESEVSENKSITQDLQQPTSSAESLKKSFDDIRRNSQPRKKGAPIKTLIANKKNAIEKIVENKPQAEIHIEKGKELERRKSSRSPLLDKIKPSEEIDMPPMLTNPDISRYENLIYSSKKKKIYIGIKDFRVNDKNYYPLRQGDLVCCVITLKGWYLVYQENNPQKYGFCPGNYLNLIN